MNSESASHLIKVLYTIGTLDLGGAERQLVDLVSNLDASRFRPHVCVLAGDEGPLVSVLRERGVPVDLLGFRGFLSGTPMRARAGKMLSVFKALFRLWRIMRRERPAIFHGVLFWAYVGGTFIARLARVPVVVTSRRSLSLFKGGKLHYLILEQLTNRMTDLVVANSEAVREDAITHEGIPPQRIIVIYNGVDTSAREQTSVRPLRDELRAGNGPLVAVVSNFIAYKGHLFFFQAWRDVVRRHPSAIAVLVGDGPTRRWWEERSRAEGWDGSVRFLGSRRDVRHILADVDLFVHPSLQEGYSNAVLEAMASSLPIVATAVGGNVEAIEDGRTGLLVPPSDSKALETAMARLLDDPALAHRLGTAAREAVEARHQLDRMVRAYEAVYQRLATGASGRNSYVWNRGAV